MIDESRARDVIEFFRLCPETVGHRAKAGLMMEPMEWQETWLTELFGRVTEEGKRQYRTAYLEVPKKNGKSTMTAILALYLLVIEAEPRAEIYSCAGNHQQARIVFRAAKAIVENSPALSERLEVRDYYSTIVNPATGGMYQAIAAKSRTAHGFDASAVIFDELHVQPDRELWDAMSMSMDAREEPLMIAITTAGIYDPASIGWEVHDYARSVIEGEVEDPSFFGVIYAADHDEDWTSEKTWRRANPSYGVTVKPDAIRAAARRAERIPGYQNAFRQLRLNQWTEQSVRWLPMASWEACRPRESEEDMIGRTCYAGLDLSSTIDLTALALVFPEEDGGFSVIPRFFVPEDRIHERSKDDRMSYAAWVRDGWMVATPGNVIDYDRVRHEVKSLAQLYPIKQLAIDRLFNATQISTQLMSDGFDVVGFGQGYFSMAAPARELEKLVVSGLLRHGDHPVLKWNAANAAVETDAAGNLKPSKRRSKEKIDGIVALTMALGRAIAEAPDEPSVYEERGVVTFG